MVSKLNHSVSVILTICRKGCVGNSNVVVQTLLEHHAMDDMGRTRTRNLFI